MAPSNTSLVFKVRRSEPELVRPAQPTPIEVKPLSHSDANKSNRFRVSNIQFYSAATIPEGMKDKDPAKVIKTALSKALVYYYPWAGRLKAGPDDTTLLVDCNAEGVGFVEADADVRLEEFTEDSLRPPFPCIHELVYNNKAHLTETEHPIFSMQVTRLLCGGFIVTYTFNHVMTDGKGVSRFVNAITELARGATTPSVLPVWQRELFNARDPPRVTCDAVLDKFGSTPNGNAMPPIAQVDTLTYRSFFFGPRELEALRSRIPSRLQGSCTSFELITASVWHSRTVALKLRPEEQVRLLFLVDSRKSFVNTPIPDGYYGNTYVPAIVVSTAGEVCDAGSLGFLVEQVKKAKEEVTEEYTRSLIDFEVMGGGRPRLPASGIGRTCLVADLSSVGLSALDFGWGEAVCSGSTRSAVISHIFSYIVAFRNKKGENGKRITLCLDSDAMETCSTALRSLIDGH